MKFVEKNGEYYDEDDNKLVGDYLLNAIKEDTYKKECERNGIPYQSYEKRMEESQKSLERIKEHNPKLAESLEHARDLANLGVKGYIEKHGKKENQ